MPEKEAIKKLQKLVKESYPKPLNSIKNFEELAESIKLSLQTIRRFFGKIDSDKNISKTSLSIICQYAGYAGWDDFLNTFNTQKSISPLDKASIENMSIFFKNGNFYHVDYHQKTLTVDTLNDYAEIIYKKKENIEYFYQHFKDNDWAVDYLFAWLPNYNFFGNEWFRKMLAERALKTKITHTKLAQYNFLFLGAFLSRNNVEYIPEIKTLQKAYASYRNEFDYMPYHEMRFHSVLLINAKNNQNDEEFHTILNTYLKNLKDAGLSELHEQEMIIFLCNTLLSLKEYSLCYELLKKAKSYIKNHPLSNEKQNPMHYFGINMVFVKTTFALTWLANKNDKIDEFELADSDFKNSNGLLYNDYIRIMHLAKCILAERKLSQKAIVFNELKLLTDKTNYTRIFDVLEDLDSNFQKYFTS